MKQVDTGGLSFQRLIEGGYYFVDKSMLIADLLGKSKEGVYLFTRPRRFGKTTNISMLDAFFNLEYRGNTWFDGLEISRHHEFDGYRNAFPVIHMDLKDLGPQEGMDYATFITGVRDVLCQTFARFMYLLDSDHVYQFEKDRMKGILDMTMDEALLPSSIKVLCGMLERHHGSRPVVLIDEYDRAITNTFGTADQKKVINFLGWMLSSTLKSNRSLQMAYVTGVTQVAKAGMFSGLNNLLVDSVFSTMSDERFGFTESETRDILEYYGHPERFGEVKQWYDGYRFGDAEVYNPFSVMMYVRNGFVPKSYWMDTSGDNPLRWMLRRTDTGGSDDLARLLAGSSVDRSIKEVLSYDDLRMAGETDIHSLMVMTGYLKAVPLGGVMYRLTIPNGEVMEVMDRMVTADTMIDSTGFAEFCAAVLGGDADAVTSALGRILEGASHMGHDRELPYEIMLLTMLRGMLRNYDVRIERESGNGRVDIIMTPTREGVTPVLIELKISDKEAELGPDAESAIAQIHSRRYYLGMQGRVVLIGIAFWGKVPSASTEVLNLRRRYGDMQEIDVFEAAPRIMDALGHGGVLLTSSAGGRTDTMTIGWGSIGIDWGMPMFTAYVRLGRFTRSLIDGNPQFTVNVPAEGSPRRSLGFCGSHSGRDTDKFAHEGLTPVPGRRVSVPAIREFPLTLECEVVYRQVQDKSLMPESIRREMYPEDVGSDCPMANRDTHVAYYGRIVDAYMLRSRA